LIEAKEKMKDQPDSLDVIASELNKAVIEEMRKIYSPQVIRVFLSPQNMGQIENPDGFAKYTGSCGDTMEIFLKIKNDRIEKITFLTDGCGTSVVCGSMVTELAQGKNVVQALRINQDKVLKELGGLPEDDLHCAELAATTLQKALNDYLAKKRDPWKRKYQV
jgi:nitrogen fixation NifU-like protein